MPIWPIHPGNAEKRETTLHTVSILPCKHGQLKLADFSMESGGRQWRNPSCCSCFGAVCWQTRLHSETRSFNNSPDPWRLSARLSPQVRPEFGHLSSVWVIRRVGVFWWTSRSLFPHACWSRRSCFTPMTRKHWTELLLWWHHSDPQRREVELQQTATELVSKVFITEKCHQEKPGNDGVLVRVSLLQLSH